MREIWLSNTAGRIPTVNQLEIATAQIGYNRTDAKLYGLRVIDGVKTVVLLGQSTEANHDRLHSMVSAADHAAVANQHKGMIPQADPATGEWKLVPMPSGGGNTNYNRIISGTVTWIENLDFWVSVVVYIFDGNNYATIAQLITLAASDPDLNRTDSICVDINSDVVILTGTPSETPVKPVPDSFTQLELTQVYIPAGATEPSNITIVPVYDENIEWATSDEIADPFATEVDFESLVAPFVNTKCIKIELTDVEGIKKLKLFFNSSVAIGLSTDGTLSMQIRSSSEWSSDSGIAILFKLAGNPVGMPVILRGNGLYGNTTMVSGWHYVTIPIADFEAAGNVDEIEMRFSYTDWGAIGFNIGIDDIKLQSGTGINPPTGTDYEWTIADDGGTEEVVSNNDKVRFKSTNSTNFTVERNTETGEVEVSAEAYIEQKEYDIPITEWLDDRLRTATFLEVAGETKNLWERIVCSRDGRTVMALSKSTFNVSALDWDSKIFLSLDGGSTWNQVLSTMAYNYQWMDIAIDYTGDNLYACNINGRIWHSTDFGVNWTELRPAGNTNQSWSKICTDSTGTTLMALCIIGKVYVSIDSGATWNIKQLTGNLTEYWYAGAISGDGSTMLAYHIDNYSVYLSRDYGETWEDYTGIVTEYTEGVAVGYGMVINQDGSKIVIELSKGLAYLEGESLTIKEDNNVYGALSMTEDGTHLAGKCAPDFTSSMLFTGTFGYDRDFLFHKDIRHENNVEGIFYAMISTAMPSDYHTVFVANWGGKLVKVTFIEFLTSLEKEITIPKLQLDAGRYHVNGVANDLVDTLRCYWQQNNKEFLNYNPEIWLFRGKRNRRRVLGTPSYSKRNKKWAHPPHLLGVKFTGGNYFSGDLLRHPVTDVAATGYHTEWELTAIEPLQKMVIPIDIWEYIYESGSSTKLTDSVLLNLDTIILRIVTKMNKMSLAFRFAIVIDNPDTTSTCPKLIGELSDSVYMVLHKHFESSVYKGRVSYCRSPKGHG